MTMPRQARLDAPGTLHHVIGRGIEGSPIFRTHFDRTDFLGRVEALCQDGNWVVYAWALLSNHFHLLVRTGKQPLAKTMSKLLTGYVVNFNRRNGRFGHLFQNRYKSIICEVDPYLLELTRYIHLNPLRAGTITDLKGLARYPWTGHSALLGEMRRDWQETETILSYFGKRKREAVKKYYQYVAEGMALGERPELVGGGLVRSMGGWSEVLSLRRRGIGTVSDERVLGSSDFVSRLFLEAEDKEKETLRLRKSIPDLGLLGRRIAKGEGIGEDDLRSGSRRRAVIEARKVFCQLAIRKMGYCGGDVARFLGVTTSAVNKAANSEEMATLQQYS